MSEEIDRQEIAKRYLLGKLSEEERTDLEERYFLDEAEFDQFEMAEGELIDRYLENELSAEDKRRFEDLVVAPGLTERVEVARLLAQRAATVAEVATPPVTIPPKPVQVGWWDRLFAIPAFKPAFAMSLIFLVMTTSALIVVWSKLRAGSQQLAQEQQQREELRRRIEEQQARYRTLEEKLGKSEADKVQQEAQTAEYERRLAEELKRSASPIVFAIVLNPSQGSRGSGGQEAKVFTITGGASQVGLTLNVTEGSEDYLRFNASVQNIDTQKAVKTKSKLTPFTQRGQKFITLQVPAKDLPAGSYNVRVDGITAGGDVQNFQDYPFRITSR